MTSPTRWCMSPRGAGVTVAGCLAAIMFAALPISLSARQNAPQAAAREEGGIKIRGHWVLEVRDPNGALAKRREFDNSLTSFGSQTLAKLLTQNASLGKWTVRLAGTTNTCAGGTLFNVPASVCYIVDSTASNLPLGTAAFPTLTVQNVSNQIVMTGSYTALAAGDITNVQTLSVTCAPTTSGSSCTTAALGSLPFTSHDLVTAQGAPAPLVVAAGQIVQVSVTISFCSSTGCQS
jgi:hypothetical protein